MRSDSSSRAAWARGFMALFAMLAMGLGLMARPAEGAPFAYVTNGGSNSVSVIDTATNTVVATVLLPEDGVPRRPRPGAVAVAPDGKHTYVLTNGAAGDSAVRVIDTASNTVVAMIRALNDFFSGVAVTPDGTRLWVTTEGAGGSVFVLDTANNTFVAMIGFSILEPVGVAIAPDGKHAYVNGDNLWVIETTGNTVVATLPGVNGGAGGVAVTPDGKHVYFTNTNGVSVIETTGNTVVATVPVVGRVDGVAVTPDGKHVYFTNGGSNTVSVIDTATNTVVATVPVGNGPAGVAVTPDGRHAYVVNSASNNVSVIDTATNTVVAMIGVGNGPAGVGIVPPPAGVPFLAFKAKLEIDLDRKPNKDRFELESHFTLSSTAPRINPVTDPVTLQIGSFSITIPPGSFKKHEGEDEDKDGFFSFHGVIDGVRLEALIKRTGTLRYAFEAEAKGANLAGTKNPVTVMLTIGGNSGTTSVKADIDH